MGGLDKIKDIFQKIKNSVSTLFKKLPFGKKHQSGTVAVQQPTAPGAQQPGSFLETQKPAQEAAVPVTPGGINQQTQTGAPQQQPTPQTVSPSGMPPQQAGQAPPQQEPVQPPDPEAVKLLQYVRQYRQQGHSDEQILKFLMQHKWPEDIVRKALEFK